MQNGLISEESLLTNVKVWIENGMPDYANGKDAPYLSFEKTLKERYGNIGKN